MLDGRQSSPSPIGQNSESMQFCTKFLYLDLNLPYRSTIKQFFPFALSGLTVREQVYLR
jgi:hypothetical protein